MKMTTFPQLVLRLRMRGFVTPFSHIPSWCSQGQLNIYLMSLMTMIVWQCCMNSKYSVGPCVVQCATFVCLRHTGVLSSNINKNIIMFEKYCRHCSTEVLQKLSCDDIHLFTESCIAAILGGSMYKWSQVTFVCKGNYQVTKSYSN
jgi:hypothetical protein